MAERTAVTLATIGDLVEDVAVRLSGEINHGADTPATIVRRRGGSAANVAVGAAELGATARFIGQVGDDPIGYALVAELRAAGVDTSPVRHDGSTGTIIALVDLDGERSMLTDRRTCVGLSTAPPAVLDGVDILHVPAYSLITAPLSETALTLVRQAHRGGITVSVDASSASIIHEYGVERMRRLLTEVEPDVLLANDGEGRALGLDGPFENSVTVIKCGPEPAVLHHPGATGLEIPAIPLGRVTDTTGAGDAFAAGFLTHAGGAVADPIGACQAGHTAAARLLADRARVRS